MNDWTVMIYMGGDNSLSDECVWAIKDICRVGLTTGIDVVIQFDSVAEGIPIRRYDIRKMLEASMPPSKSKSEQRLLRSDTDGTLHDLAYDITGGGRSNTRETEESLTDPEVLLGFLRYSTETYPATNYMLIFSGHGSGADEDVFMRDDNPPGFITVRRLRWMLEQARKNKLFDKIDILGLDSCAMSTVEIAYELRDVVRYLVAGEGLQPGTGWPHYRIIEALKSKRNISAKALSQEIVHRHVNYYSDYTVAGISVDLAACDLSKIKDVERAVMNLGRKLLGRMKSNPESDVLAERLALDHALIENCVIMAHWRAQSYRFEDYVDLQDFCELLKTSLVDSVIKSACQQVIDAITSCVIECCYSGADFQHSRGLSIYFPWAGNIPERYLGLSFSCSKEKLPSRKKLFTPDENCASKKVHKGKSWLKFLDKYLKGTQRAHRNDLNQGKADLQHIDSGSSILLEVRLNDPINRLNDPINRLNDPINRGILGRVPRVKNPPKGFYRDFCQKPTRKRSES